MASFTVSPNSSILLLRLQPSSPSQISPVLPSYQKQFSCRRSRGSVVVPRGGAPGASTYVFAFVFPLSLLAVTIFTAIIISDKLDRDFYEEQEVNQSMLEAENEDEDVPPTFEEPSTQQRTRNRPKREAEISGREFPRVTPRRTVLYRGRVPMPKQITIFKSRTEPEDT
ncbi:hypothetical protein SSX86_022908 [Deinandra increscens subsp. villosa]|uniref:Uncharacterized protein n=1 Tax=Deinandra increscens subsp. villosa TaxID=3103831 RepID=A0AAP0CP77_9ASTR